MDPLLDRLLPSRGARARPVLLAAAVLLGVLVLAGAVVVAGSASDGSTTDLPSARLERATATPTPLLVQVSGAVRRPGLVALPAGSRVVDAVAAAGGPTAKADEGGLNLAARVADGQQVLVPERGAATAAPGGTTASAGAAVSLGSATQEQLETLPDIGPALAQRIIAYRTEHGGFASVEELQQVSGIGPKTFAGLKDRVVP